MSACGVALLGLEPVSAGNECAPPCIACRARREPRSLAIQTSGEQQRHVRNTGAARRVCTQQGVCGLAQLAKGMAIGCAVRLASIPVVCKRIFRSLLKPALVYYDLRRAPGNHLILDGNAAHGGLN